MVKHYNGGMFGCTIQGSQPSSTCVRTNNNDSLFGGAIEDSSNNPEVSGTIGAALGITN